MEAIPPQDFDKPYSSLPSNVVLKRVKKNVQNSYINMAKAKRQEIEDKKTRVLAGSSYKGASMQKTIIKDQKEPEWLKIIE
jgi:hypothetical protein